MTVKVRAMLAVIVDDTVTSPGKFAIPEGD
jgi:hypothetical protein